MGASWAFARIRRRDATSASRLQPLKTAPSTSMHMYAYAIIYVHTHILTIHTITYYIPIYIILYIHTHVNHTYSIIFNHGLERCRWYCAIGGTCCSALHLQAASWFQFDGVIAMLCSGWSLHLVIPCTTGCSHLRHLACPFMIWRRKSNDAWWSLCAHLSVPSVFPGPSTS